MASELKIIVNDIDLNQILFYTFHTAPRRVVKYATEKRRIVIAAVALYGFTDVLRISILPRVKC